MTLARDSYECNSYLSLENLFSENDIDCLNKYYDEFYKANNIDPFHPESISKPLTGPLEYHRGFASLIASKLRLFDTLDHILGPGFQYVGSDTINVGNDTHGAHRDYCYKHDIAKVLICLNDRFDDSKVLGHRRKVYVS